MPRATAKVTDLRQARSDRYGQLTHSESRGGLTWVEADATLLRSAAAAVTEDGAALLLTKTSDGGALCIQVWTGTDRHKLYPASATELREALQLIIEIANS